MLIFALEPRGRKPRPAATARERCKPVAISDPQISDRLLGRGFRDLQHPGELVPLDAVQELAQIPFVGLRERGIGLAGRVLLVPLTERPVVGKARHAAGPGEVLSLGLGWDQTDHVCSEHTGQW